MSDKSEINLSLFQVKCEKFSILWEVTITGTYSICRSNIDFRVLNTVVTMVNCVAAVFKTLGLNVFSLFF